MKVLTREEILRNPKVITKEVPVPEWSNGKEGCVLVKGLSAQEWDNFEEIFVREQSGTPKGIRARLVSMAVVGEDLKPIFSLEDVQELGKVNAKALKRVFDVAQDLSGFGPDALEEMKGN